jgi:hypothetical protein
MSAMWERVRNVAQIRAALLCFGMGARPVAAWMALGSLNRHLSAQGPDENAATVSRLSLVPTLLFRTSASRLPFDYADDYPQSQFLSSTNAVCIQELSISPLLGDLKACACGLKLLVALMHCQWQFAMFAD